MLALAEALMAGCAVSQSEPKPTEDGLANPAWDHNPISDLVFVAVLGIVIAQVLILEHRPLLHMKFAEMRCNGGLI